jgi:hypothetical protein
MSIDELSALRDQVHEVLSAKLVTRKAALERRLQQLNQPSKVLETVKLGVQKLLVTLHCGCAWTASAARIESLSF